MSGIALIVSMLISGFGALQQQTEQMVTEESQEFKLTYMICGMGSNFGDRFPTFRVQGTRFTYSSEQNSYYTKPNLEPIKICEGTMRNSAIDSIMDILNSTTEREFYVTDIGVRSGTINYLIIEDHGNKWTFTMHNEHDPMADKIIRILDSHIPAKYERI